MLLYNVLNRTARYSPYLLNQLMLKIPFNIRYGNAYSHFREKIGKSIYWNDEDIEEYVISSFNKIFQHAKEYTFYREKYSKEGILNLKIKTINDIKKIPLLYKKEIIESTHQFKGHYSAKTGGTTGKRMKFFLDKYVWSREWAHYHKIWKQADYKYTDTMISFRDRNINDKFIDYSFELNEYYINIFQIPIMSEKQANDFLWVLKNKKVEYFKGYPSAIYDFLKVLDKKISSYNKEIIKKQIKCCFLNSEIVTKQIMDYLQNDWNFNVISSYGHSEACIIASTQVNNSVYYPYHTYGYAEVENNILVGTSYHNFDMPLIRYVTDDVVTPSYYKNNILKSFKIIQGRKSDIIYDKENKRIPITGFFLRFNEKAYDYANHYQVFQKMKGKVTILITKKERFDNSLDFYNLLNLKNYNIDFKIEFIEKPIRTRSGKIPLKITDMNNALNRY